MERCRARVYCAARCSHFSERRDGGPATRPPAGPLQPRRVAIRNRCGLYAIGATKFAPVAKHSGVRVRLRYRNGVCSFLPLDTLVPINWSGLFSFWPVNLLCCALSRLSRATIAAVLAADAKGSNV